MEENDNLEVQVYSSMNEYEVNQVAEILTENSIPFIRKEEGSGAYMSLYMGQSIQEKKIYVAAKDLDKALELISGFISNDTEKIENETFDEEDDEISDDFEEEKQNKNSSKKYVMIRRIVGASILAIPVIVFIVVMVFNATHK